MAIFRRTVSKYGKSGGYFLLPSSFIGKEVVVIADDDLQQFSELIHTAYMLNKVSDSELTKINLKFEDLKNDLIPRLQLIERLVTSMIKPVRDIQSLDKKNSGTQTEHQVANILNSTTSPDN